MDIDLVYLWVNGNDPEWIAKRQACIGDLSLKDVNCKGRYADNGELRYSLRSIEKYAPWVHKIFIVTDNQVPEWLDTSHPKIQIVDHTEIMPPECLPCFNSNVIEHYLHKIPGLSEHFLYANDDMFINQPVTPETFFGTDGLPKVRMNRRPFRKFYIYFKTKVQKKQLSNYMQNVHITALLVEKKYGKYFNCKTHHNIDAYLRSHYEHTRQVFDEEINANRCNHVRTRNDIQRNLFSYVLIAEKQAHVCYVTQHTSFRLHIDNHECYAKFLKYKPVFFCMNDSEFANDDDRRRAAAFLRQYFPDKSQFETIPEHNEG